MSAGRWDDGQLRAAETLKQFKADHPGSNVVIDGLRVDVSDLKPGAPVETAETRASEWRDPYEPKPIQPMHAFSASFTPKGMRVVVTCKALGTVAVAIPLADGAEVDCPCGWLLRTRVVEGISLYVSEFDTVERQILARASEVKKPTPAPQGFTAVRAYAEVTR